MTEKTSERIAIALWHRFAPESHEEWSEEMYQAEYRDAANAVSILATHELRTSLKAMLALFDDEGNMTATFEELQDAVNGGYDTLTRTKPSYEITAGGPFYGAECPDYPNCSGGCGLGCTHEVEGSRASVGEARKP